MSPATRTIKDMNEPASSNNVCTPPGGHAVRVKVVIRNTKFNSKVLLAFKQKSQLPKISSSTVYTTCTCIQCTSPVHVHSIHHLYMYTVYTTCTCIQYTPPIHVYSIHHLYMYIPPVHVYSIHHLYMYTVYTTCTCIHRLYMYTVYTTCTCIHHLYMYTVYFIFFTLFWWILLSSLISPSRCTGFFQSHITSFF